MAEVDFRDQAGKIPEEVGFRDFRPMWTYPPTAVNSKYDNITFGIDTSPLIDQCPMVVFKASTVLQSLGIIASRILLPSSDTQAETRERTYCQLHGTMPTAITLQLSTAMPSSRKVLLLF